MGLPADNRIRRPADFRHVLTRGRRTGTRAEDRLLLISATPNGRPGPRIGLSVGKRVGGAVVRNRVKRRLREIFREIEVAPASAAAIVEGADQGGAGWDIVATARPAAAEASSEELRASVARLMVKVKSRR
ncbi:MAG: ribonuclease P protein component [Chloroflexi bacterium]|nr:ribonuclease P protein component [Chloroflexota bacterium]MDA1296749.1 ribonuclease P protein component [Chloroflexota bacterium]